MPLQRSNNSSLGVQQVDGVVAKGSAAPGAADVGDAADADEVEDERYCFCGGVSYGEMIACDDDNCEREWVRFLKFVSIFWADKVASVPSCVCGNDVNSPRTMVLWCMQ